MTTPTVTPLFQNPSKGGGPLGWSNCFPTKTAEQIAFETANAKRPNGGQVRSHVVNDDGTPDTTGGTRPSQNVAAAKAAYGVTLDYRLIDIDEMWRLSEDPTYHFSVCISYAPVSGTRFDGSPGFRGFHQVGLWRRRVNDPLADSRRPGIPTAPDDWPFDLLRRAAEGYSRIPGKACVVVARWPKDAAKPRRYSVAFEPGAFFVYPETGGRRRDDGFTRRTSAPCSAPFTIPWGSGRKRVVTMLKGRLKGLRVEPTATHLRLVEG